MSPSQSTLPQSTQPGHGSAQSVQRCNGAFGDDTAAFCSGDRRRFAPFPWLAGQRVIHFEADVTAFLSWREAIRLDWACLAVPLEGHLWIGAVPVVIPAPV